MFDDVKIFIQYNIEKDYYNVIIEIFGERKIISISKNDLLAPLVHKYSLLQYKCEQQKDYINYLERRLKTLERENKEQKQESEINGIFGEWGEF